MSFGDAGAGLGGVGDKEVQEFVMMEEQKAQFMMQNKDRDKLDPTLEVVVGTYEELSLGYRLASDDVFEQTFTDHSHAGCVRAAAISSNGILATGSSDEMIRLFNLRKNKELGALVQHRGSITWLEFFSNTHLFSCSEDGTIGLWSTRNWECLKTFKGHKGAVHCCSFHPSGKLAMSVGHDKTLRLWNLVTGRGGYTTHLKMTADLVKWSRDGDRYMIVQNCVISIYKTEGASHEREIVCSSRVHAVENTNEGLLIVGLEEGLVVVYELSSGEKLLENQVHDRRVKTMVLLESVDSKILVTGSSDSKIKFWNILGTGELKLRAEIDTKFRITSMGAWFRKNINSRNRTPKVSTADSADLVEEQLDSVDLVEEKTEKKRAKIDIEYENDGNVVAKDRLAQRLLKKTGRKKGTK